MLISLPETEFSASLRPAQLNPDDLPKFEQFVSALAEVVKAGQHWVYADPRTLQEFSKWPHLEHSQRQALSGAARANTHVDIAISELEDLLILTGLGTTNPMPLTRTPSGQREHRRPWTLLLDHERGLLNPAVVLGENRGDAAWIVWMARAFAALQGQPGSLSSPRRLALAPHGYGGSAVNDQLQGHVDEGRLVLVVADSDRDHPDALLEAPPAHLTCAAAARAVASLPVHATPVDCEIWRVREAEHQVPSALARAVLGDTSQTWRKLEDAGFWLRADRPADADLRWIAVDKSWCPFRLLQHPEERVRALRLRVAKRLCQNAPLPGEADWRCLGSVGYSDCGAPSKKPVPSVCQILAKVDKDFVRSLADHLKNRDKDPSLTARWLAAQVHPKEHAFWDMARRAWSWGLALPPTVRGGP